MLVLDKRSYIMPLAVEKLIPINVDINTPEKTGPLSSVDNE